MDRTASGIPWGENEEIVGLISRFVTHYLTEPGHPADPDQVFQAPGRPLRTERSLPIWVLQLSVDLSACKLFSHELIHRY